MNQQPGWLILLGFITFVAIGNFLLISEKLNETQKGWVMGVYLSTIGAMFLLSYYQEKNHIYLKV